MFHEDLLFVRIEAASDGEIIVSGDEQIPPVIIVSLSIIFASSLTKNNFWHLLDLRSDRRIQ